MKVWYAFFMLFSSVFNGFVNTTTVLNGTQAITKGNETNQTTVIISTAATTTHSNGEMISTSTALLNVTTISEINTSIIDSNPPSKRSLKSYWWIVIVIIVIVVITLSIGIIHYYRRKSPYRRFLQGWRSRDDDRDNIILQLEQPEIINSQWPPRISFA